MFFTMFLTAFTILVYLLKSGFMFRLVVFFNVKIILLKRFRCLEQLQLRVFLKNTFLSCRTALKELLAT